jgi:tripartite ATP-independent transporter DctM subunit
MVELAQPMLIIGFFVIVLFIFYSFGVPVAYAMGMTVLALMISPIGEQLVIETAITRMYSGVDSFILLAVPFFLLAGRLMNSMGMTDDIFDFAEELVGFLRGGLGHVNVVVSIIFSGMSGSAVADAAGLGTIEYKAMTERGYEPKFASGITGASATIGPIIPPSIIMIIYAMVAEQSVGAMFVGGIIPGFLMGGLLMLTIYIIAIRRGLAPAKKIEPRLLIRSAVRAVPALITPIIIVGGIIGGIFTPTEAAVIASFYALLLATVYYRNLSFEQLYDDLLTTFLDTTAILIILSFANLYAFWLNINGIPFFIADLLTSVPGGATVTFAAIILTYLILGTFIDATAIILITVPLLVPVFPQLGINPIHFGVVGIIALMIGLVTPPLGLILFVLERVTDLELDDIIRGMLPFYAPLIAVLIILILIPDLVLFLPRMFGLG